MSKRTFKLYDHVSVAEAIRKRSDCDDLLDHAAFLLVDHREYVQALVKRIHELEALVVRLGGGFDRRGLDGDPKEPPPPPQVLKQGSWVDEGSHA